MIHVLFIALLIAILESIALAQKIDGIMFSAATAALGGIAGGIIGYLKGKRLRHGKD